jgi:hypothetical protein
MFAHLDSNSSTPQSRALLGLGSAGRRPSGAELAGSAVWAEQGHFISAIVIEVDEVALPARSGADSAALTIATDEVRGIRPSRIADNAGRDKLPL